MPKPRKKYTIEEARAFAKKNPEQFNAALDKINPDPYRGTKKLADLLIKQYPERYKDYKPEDFISMLDSISKVESGNKNIAQKSVNPKTKKSYDGPARGYFQIEKNTAPVAQKRYQNYQEILKAASAVPLPDIKVPKDGDVRSLSKDEQARLALSNMSATAASRKQSLNPLNSQDSWLNYHWNGAPKDRSARTSHWKEVFGFGEGGKIKPIKPEKYTSERSSTSTKNTPELGRNLNTLPNPDGILFDKTLINLLDPTGISNYPDLIESFKTGKNIPENIISSIPLVGKVGMGIKALRSARTGVPVVEGLIKATSLGTDLNLNQYPKGGAIKPYVTNDPNDPRIQAYKDSSLIADISRRSADISKIPNITQEQFNRARLNLLNNTGYNLAETRLRNLNGKQPIPESESDEFKLDEFFTKNTNKIYKKPVQPVVYQKPQVKQTITTNTVNKVKPISRTKPKAVAKPVQSTPVTTPQVTPEAQTQINTGKEEITKLAYRTDSTGKKHYRVNGKDVPDSVYKSYEKLKHKKVEYGLGGSIGGILGGIAGNMLIPGVGGMLGSQLGSVLGKGAEGMFAQGGMSGLTPINVEGHNVNSISMAKAKKGELLVNNGNMIKNYISRPVHPERGQNPLGDDLVQPGSIVIPKNRSQEYLNAGRALRKQIEASVVSQQVAREGNMMRKGGLAKRSKMAPGGMAQDYFDREYPYAPALNPHVDYAQVEQGGNHYMEGDAYRNARNGLPASYNNMNPMTSRDPFSSRSNQNVRTQMSNQKSVTNPYGQGTPGEQDPGMSDFDKMNLGQLGLNLVPAIGDIIDATASVQTPQFKSLRNVNPNLIDPNTGQSQINQGYRSGYNSLRDSGVYSIKSNRNLVADRMQRSGDQALNIANQNAQIKNQFVGMNTDINKYNLDLQNQAELYKMQGQAKRREARRNLLDRAPYAASQYMQNGLYAKMLGI